ncbi:hypothetical protein FACS1894206_08790 [Deltaproteobacteria bacterium]|nr:hypothetical protein FACS1894206_08790 [Deltaproteobacteria bacterium]
MKKIFIALLTVLLCLSAVTAQAAWTPKKEIRILVAYNAGGQCDIFARKIAAIIQQKNLLPVAALVVNMTAGNTKEALNALHNADPDGLTLMLHHSALSTMNALGQIQYTFKDFTNVCEVVETTSTLSVSADAKWKTFEELLADAKAQKGALKVALPGIGNVNHFSALNLLMQMGQQGLFKEIPYVGGADAATAVMGKQVDLRYVFTTDVARFVRSGAERVLLILNTEPLEEFFPGVPAASKFGMKQAIISRLGIMAPPKLPEEIRSALSLAVKQATETPEYQQFCKEQFSRSSYRDGPEWGKLQDADEALIKEIAKSLKK